MIPKTVCAGCGENNGEHAIDCKDLDGIRIRLEKRIKELEGVLVSSVELAVTSNELWNAAIEAAAVAANDRIEDNIDAVMVCRAIRNLKKGK